MKRNEYENYFMHRNAQYSERKNMHNSLRNICHAYTIYAQLSVVRMLALFLKPRVWEKLSLVFTTREYWIKIYNKKKEYYE